MRDRGGNVLFWEFCLYCLCAELYSAMLFALLEFWLLNRWVICLLFALVLRWLCK